MSSKPTTTHGGKRKRSGRKPIAEPLQVFSVRLTQQQSDFLYQFGQQDRKKGIRDLIDAAIARGDLGQC